MRRRLLASAVVAAAALLCGAVSGIARAQTSADDVEHALPTGSVLVREVQAGGAQVYACRETAGAYAWTLTGPQAVLVNDDGTFFGVHIPGPKWAAQDGSSIVANGEHPLAKIARPAAVAELLLPVTVSAGNGILSHVLYVSRTDTEGGLPPDAGCDATHLDATIARHYSAVYRFFR